MNGNVLYHSPLNREQTTAIRARNFRDPGRRDRNGFPEPKAQSGAQAVNKDDLEGSLSALPRLATMQRSVQPVRATKQTDLMQYG